MSLQSFNTQTAPADRKGEIQIACNPGHVQIDVIDPSSKQTFSITLSNEDAAKLAETIARVTNSWGLIGRVILSPESFIG
jgi:hypothetical protein